MCKLKSGLLFKNGVFVPDYDSHDKMLTEKGIEDTAENRIAEKFVRFELSPENDDPFVPIDMWVFKIDQDELPEWIKSDPEKYEAIARAAVKEWAEKHIFIGIDKLNLTDGSGYYLKDCTNVTLSGSSTVQDMRGSSTVQDMWDSSTVRNMWDSSTVRNMRGRSTVQIAGNRSKGISVETIILSQNATIKDFRTKTLYAVGDWKFSIKEASDA